LPGERTGILLTVGLTLMTALSISHGDSNLECEYCEHESVVPVLDKNIELSPRPGNKYRRACLSCDKWNPATSEETWRTARHPTVLKKGGEGIDDLIRLEEYDYDPELRQLIEEKGLAPEEPEEPGEPAHEEDADAERVTESEESSDAPEVPDTEPDEDEEEEEEEESVNEFECPSCGCHVIGRPDECPGCEADYNW